MALNRDKQFVFKNGEFAIATGADFNAGGPLMVSGSGTELGYAKECSNDDAYIGLALQSSEDADTNGKIAFYAGTGLFTLEADTISGSAEYPYDNSKTYTPGDPICVNTTLKKWTNDTASFSSNKKRGTVIAVGSASLTVLFNA